MATASFTDRTRPKTLAWGLFTGGATAGGVAVRGAGTPVVPGVTGGGAGATVPGAGGAGMPGAGAPGVVVAGGVVAGGAWTGGGAGVTGAGGGVWVWACAAPIPMQRADTTAHSLTHVLMQASPFAASTYARVRKFHVARLREGYHARTLRPSPPGGRTVDARRIGCGHVLS